MLLQKVKEKVWSGIHKNRRNPVVARIVKLCKNIHRASEHPGHDVKINGEMDCLRRTVPVPAPTIFDVGANIGSWSLMCQELYPRATIHSFELSPKTAETLIANLKGRKGIHIHPFGLSSAAGEVNFFSYEDDASVLSGMRPPLWSHVPHSVQKALVQTGDQFCEENKIEKVDYLKIDAEGSDYEVLLGFKRMLSEGKILALQYELEWGRYLRDFYDYLNPLGYTVGKLYANYVAFGPHHQEMEHFLGPNYVAVRSDQTALIELLKKGW